LIICNSKNSLCIFFLSIGRDSLKSDCRFIWYMYRLSFVQLFLQVMCIYCWIQLYALSMNSVRTRQWNAKMHQSLNNGRYIYKEVMSLEGDNYYKNSTRDLLNLLQIMNF
jgi:hypothetical protein